jgi:hypothetical protein
MLISIVFLLIAGYGAYQTYQAIKNAPLIEDEPFNINKP